MTTYACLFEAKSIQDYLFQSGRLRDVIGASELVDSLTGELLDRALTALDLKEGRDRDIEFSRRAGGAFYAFSDDAGVLDRLLALWTLLVQQHAPAMAYDLGRGGPAPTALEAFDQAQTAMRADAPRLRPRQPVAAPITLRSRRTGLAAEGLDRDGGPVDAAGVQKRRLADLSQAGLIGRFSPPEATLAWRDWPRNLEPDEDGAFPFNGDNRTLALIHADGNGLGQLLMRARTAARDRPDAFIAISDKLSRIIAESTERAAQQATREVLLPERLGNGPLPARPILLGGDDLTILVRGDLGLVFLRAFAAAFEDESRRALPALAELGLTDLPSRLTIGAGLVWLRSSQPFYLGSHLVETLMAAAKTRAKAVNRDDPPSAIAFHRVTAALVDDYVDIIERERSHSHDGRRYIDTAGPYLLDEEAPGPQLTDLLQLQALLAADGMARGPTRQLLTLLGLDPAQAQAGYRRWRELMTEHQRDRLKLFDELLQRLVVEPEPWLPFGRPLGGATEDELVSPLGDAIALMSVTNRLPDSSAGNRDVGGAR